MSKYYSADRGPALDRGQLVLARCPDWCIEGYQVCRWNGLEFHYYDQPNETFNETVIAFMVLTDDGEPVKLN